MHQTVNSIVCLEGQPYETVFDPVGLVASHIEGVAILSTLAALPHSPLHCFMKKFEKKKDVLSPSTSVALPTSQLGIGIGMAGAGHASTFSGVCSILSCKLDVL